MSVSDMNVSWSTRSGHSAGNTGRSASLAGGKQGLSKRPKCVSAKHSGMRFQSWREPKPLRTRCHSAVILPESETDKTNTERQSSARRPEVKESSENLQEILDRLSKPTKSSHWKTSSARAREVGTDMNYYSWAKMNVYKDYQKVLYADNGTVKNTSRTKD